MIKKIGLILHFAYRHSFGSGRGLKEYVKSFKHAVEIYNQ